jgi:hypothetical protein
MSAIAVAAAFERTGWVAAAEDLESLPERVAESSERRSAAVEPGHGSLQDGVRPTLRAG